MANSLTVRTIPKRRSRRSLPVLSRLTVAWLSLAIGLGAMGAGLKLFAANSSERFAVNIDDVEQFASATQSVAPAHAEAPLAQPELAERLPMPDSPRSYRAQARGHSTGALAPSLAAAARPEDGEIPSPSATRAARGGPKVIRIADALNAPVGDRRGGWRRLSAEASNLGGDTDDMDASGDTGGPVGDIMITIDGKPAAAPGAFGRPRTRPARPIPGPLPALTRDSPFGPVPAIAPDGEAPYRAYAHSFVKADTPHIGLIVSGLGLDATLTARAIEELPAEVSLSFAPYAKDLPYWTARAREAGHEILLELPMEQGSGRAEELGPAGLITGRAPADNIKRLEWMMARFGGYVGATNYLGVKFASDSNAIRPVLARLRASGLYFFDDTGAVRRTGAPTARDVAGVSQLVTPGDGDPARELALLEEVAERDGVALGKVYVAPDTFEPLAAWARTLPDRDLTLAPASAVFALTSSANG